MNGGENIVRLMDVGGRFGRIFVELLLNND